MTPEQEAALRELERCSKILKGITRGDGAEKQYGQAYQRCVQLGVKPQIKKKYRK